MARILECDLVGAGLLALGVTPLMIGVIWGGVTAPWKSAQVLAPLLIGLAFLGALAFHQIRVKTDGLFHPELFQSRNLTLSMFGFFVEGERAAEAPL